jgi:hypothetical protein
MIRGNILTAHRHRTWKVKLWLRSSFSGNICFEFSVLVLCNVNAIPDQCCMRRTTTGFSMVGKQPTGGFAQCPCRIRPTTYFSCMRRHATDLFPHASQENVYILKVVHAREGLPKDLSLHGGLFFMHGMAYRGFVQA